jgi:hypothetical protein
MATVMNRHHSQNAFTFRTSLQKICIGMGIVFVLIGILGIFVPGLLTMHLSFSHNLIHLVSGSLAIWAGYSDDSNKAYHFAIGFGIFYGLLGLAGFVFGEPGFPGVGHLEADDNLLRVLPNALEFGSADHLVHLVIASVFLGSAFAHKHRRDRRSLEAGRRAPMSTTELFHESADRLNSESDLPDVDLGRSDVNRRSDWQRRSDFERRI